MRLEEERARKRSPCGGVWVPAGTVKDALQICLSLIQSKHLHHAESVVVPVELIQDCEAGVPSLELGDALTNERESMQIDGGGLVTSRRLCVRKFSWALYYRNKHLMP